MIPTHPSVSDIFPALDVLAFHLADALESGDGKTAESLADVVGAMLQSSCKTHRETMAEALAGYELAGFLFVMAGRK